MIEDNFIDNDTNNILFRKINHHNNSTTSNSNYNNHNTNTNNHTTTNNNNETTTTIIHHLDNHIKILFTLNGIVQVIPNLALMALMNDRIQLPAKYIPTYYAISFLPYSLKFLYGLCTDYWVVKLRSTTITTITTATTSTTTNQSNIQTRYYSLIIVLQLCTSLSFSLTTTLGENQITPCFIMTFLRGFTISFAEFVVGLLLIVNVKSKSKHYNNYNNSTNDSSSTHHHDDNLNDSTQHEMEYYNKNQQQEETILSFHQSQAATYRNLGSWIGQIVVFGIILVLSQQNNNNDDTNDNNNNNNNDGDDNIISIDGSLSNVFINTMLWSTALIPILSAMVAYNGKTKTYEEVKQNDNRDSLHTQRQIKHDQRRRVGYDRVSTSSEIVTTDMSNMTRERSTQQQSHLFHIKRVAVYLVSRHAIPSTSGVVGSFLYTVFRSKPFYLQCMTLLTSTSTVFASWSYGHIVSKKYAKIKEITRIIIIVTIVNSIWSLLFIPFYNAFRYSIHGDKSIDGDDVDGNNNLITFDGSMTLLGFFTLFQIVGGFIEEISFLPSVVLATNSLIHLNDNESTTNRRLQELDEDISQNDDDIPWYMNDGVLYGFMISCIDIGDQIGDWVAGPTVKVLNIERENYWENLNWFIVISSVCSLISLLFLRLLWYASKPVDI